MTRPADTQLDLDPLDITMAIMLPIYGLGAGVMLGLSRDFRREGLALLAISAVTMLLLLGLLVAVG